jgi:hypothetical protein
VFHRKSKAEKARDVASERAHRAGKAAAKTRDKAAKNARHAGKNVKQGTESLLDKVRDRYGDRAGAAAATAAGAAATAAGVAATARDRAVSGLDHGIDSAVPKVEGAVAGVGPKVDHARDMIVDDLLPKISELLGGFQSAKDDFLSKQEGPVAVVTGAPKKRSRKGGLLLTLGVLAAIGAGIAYYLNQQQSRSKSDPWAGAPDRPIGGAPGVDSQVRDQLDGPAAGAGAAGVGATGLGATGLGATGAAGNADADDTPVRSAPVADAPVAPDAAGAETSGAGSGSVHMLDADEIDQYASDTPSDTDEADVPGTNTDATTGLGTDSGGDDSRVDKGADDELGGTPRP